MLGEKERHIVFIGHDASLSGAPLLLLQLLLLLKSESGITVKLFLGRGGALEETYRNNFPTTVLKPRGYGKGKSIFSRVKEIVKNRIQMLKLYKTVYGCDVVFSNTIINGHLLKFLSGQRKPIITYVHELDNVVETYMASKDSYYSLKYSTAFAYPSLRVKEMLLGRYNVPESKLNRLSYYFPVQPDLDYDAKAHVFASAFREKYGLKDFFLVGSMGTLSERKGTDLFINVAELVVRQNSNIKFCWAGKAENEEEEQRYKQMALERGIGDKVVFTGQLSPNIYNAAAYDLFFLSSREDPYPLVVLEAALVKVPTVCFENAGGIPEFVGDDAGWVVQDFSPQAVSNRILSLYADHEQLHRKGQVAQRKCISLHTDKKTILEQFGGLI